MFDILQKAVSVSRGFSECLRINVSQLTHQLLNNALSIGRCMKLTPEDILCAYPWCRVPKCLAHHVS